MKVILLFPKWTFNYGIASHFAKKASVWQPLNLAILGAIAEEAGHEVKIIDGQAEDITIPEMVKQVVAFKPDIIGITGATPFFHITTELASELKKVTDIPIAVGGAHITVLKKKAFSPQFDYGFVGEADNSFMLFLAGVQSSHIRGVLYRNNGNIESTGMPSFINDINSIPAPARHLLKMNKYRLGTLQGVKPFTSIMYSRGCPFNCIYCSTEVFGKKVRVRKVESVIEEIESVVSDFGTKHFMFADDNLTLNKQYTLDLCKLIIQEKLPITFEGSTRANLIDEELISIMAKAGLTRLSFGLESVNPEIRKTMKKEVPLESYKVANKLVNKYGIECLNSVMIGLPGETPETVDETLSYLRNSHDIKQANSSIAIPYPGTELYNMAKKGEHGLKLLTADP